MSQALSEAQGYIVYEQLQPNAGDRQIEHVIRVNTVVIFFKGNQSRQRPGVKVGVRRIVILKHFPQKGILILNIQKGNRNPKTFPSQDSLSLAIFQFSICLRKTTR